MNQIVMVPVPVEKLERVYAALAQNPTRDATKKWKDQDLKMLIQEEGPRAFLMYLASKPEEWITFKEVSKGTGIEEKDLRGALSVITKTSNRLGRGDWPCDVNQSRAGMRYQMHRQEASDLLRVANE